MSLQASLSDAYVHTLKKGRYHWNNSLCLVFAYPKISETSSSLVQSMTYLFLPKCHCTARMENKMRRAHNPTCNLWDDRPCAYLVCRILRHKGFQIVCRTLLKKNMCTVYLLYCNWLAKYQTTVNKESPASVVCFSNNIVQSKKQSNTKSNLSTHPVKDNSPDSNFREIRPILDGGTIQSTLSCNKPKCLSSKIPTFFQVCMVCFAKPRKTMHWIDHMALYYVKMRKQTCSEYFTPQKCKMLLHSEAVRAWWNSFAFTLCISLDRGIHVLQSKPLKRFSTKFSFMHFEQHGCHWSLKVHKVFE